MRPLLLIAIVVGACFASMKLTPHHAASNDRAFEALYMHLMPEPILGGHGEHADEAHGDVDPAHGAADEHAGADEHAAEAEHALATHADEHGDDPMRGRTLTTVFNLQIFQIAAVLLVLAAFSGVPTYLRTGEGDRITRVLAGWCQFIKDEMVEPNMHGSDGKQFLPYFLSVFFFVAGMNLMGLVPGSVTPTANIFVTGALAASTFVAMVGCGMAKQGPVAFWKNLVPHVPLFLWPLMFVVELLGLLVKPFALMIRLFANMTGGHLVVLSFLGLIFIFAGKDFSALGYGVSPVAVGFAVFIMIIEGFVALMQAYIFTQLTILFVGASVHPEH